MSTFMRAKGKDYTVSQILREYPRSPTAWPHKAMKNFDAICSDCNRAIWKISDTSLETVCLNYGTVSNACSSFMEAQARGQVTEVSGRLVLLQGGRKSASSVAIENELSAWSSSMKSIQAQANSCWKGFFHSTESVWREFQCCHIIAISKL